MMLRPSSPRLFKMTPPARFACEYRRKILVSQSPLCRIWACWTTQVTVTPTLFSTTSKSCSKQHCLGKIFQMKYSPNLLKSQEVAMVCNFRASGCSTRSHARGPSSLVENLTTSTRKPATPNNKEPVLVVVVCTFPWATLYFTVVDVLRIGSLSFDPLWLLLATVKTIDYEEGE